LKKKWNVTNIENKYVILPVEQMSQVLEEFAEMIYLDFCQLQKNSPLDSADITSNEEKRTGTDG
jgi:hypothetical protein